MLNIFRNTVYIRLRADEIYLLHLESGAELTMPPEMAIETIGSKKKIVAVGNEVAEAKKLRPGIEVVNGFKHPRSLIAISNSRTNIKILHA